MPLTFQVRAFMLSRAQKLVGKEGGREVPLDSIDTVALTVMQVPARKKIFLHQVVDV